MVVGAIGTLCVPNVIKKKSVHKCSTLVVVE
jgi:hypothetical protein